VACFRFRFCPIASRLSASGTYRVVREKPEAPLEGESAKEMVMHNDPQSSLKSLLATVRRQYELVPFMQELHPVQAMEFKPLPDEMLVQIRSSPDFREPEIGTPVLLMLEADHASGGLMIVRVPGSETMYVRAPIR
jgi:hypothetical protein